MAMAMMITPLKWTQTSITHSPYCSQTLISPKRRSANDVVSLNTRQLDRSSIFSGALTNLHTCKIPKLKNDIVISKASGNGSFAASSDDEFLNQIEQLAMELQIFDNSDVSSPFESSSNFESIDPQWPEILIKHKTNNLDLPFSLQMIKRKKQSLQREDDKFGDTSYNSMKKAFASMVFIIRELYRYAFKMKELLTYEDLHGVLISVHREMYASFVWLFSQVFSHTPTFMVYIMTLLANFTVHSVASNTDTIVSSSPSSSTMLQAISVLKPPDNSDNEFDTSTLKTFPICDFEDSGRTSNGLSKESSLDFDDNNEAKFEYFMSELLYQIFLLQEPNNPLILANYAQFLYLFDQDHERAEEYFKKAIETEPKDPEAFNKYAEFLWRAKEDLPAAEETYLEAISVEPSNTYYAASYANFLWNTGGDQGTCFLHENPEGL